MGTLRGGSPRDLPWSAARGCRSGAAAVAKWTHHAPEAAREAPHAVAMAIRYNTRIRQVLGYMATMSVLIPDTASWDNDTVCRMLGLPGSSMPYRGINELAAEWGFPQFVGAQVYCRAAVAMTAAQTEPK